MDADAARVSLLYQDPHPAHRGFAEAIGADLVNYRGRAPAVVGQTLAADVYNGLVYPDYDVFLVEGSRPLYAASIHRLLGGGKLIYLCADHGLYALGSSEFEGDTGLKSVIGRFGHPAIRAVGSRAIDGVIAVSEFAAGFTRPVVGSGTPIQVAHPYIQPDVYRTLGNVDPDLASKTAVTVGRADRYKGVDLLVEAWPAVRRDHPDAELHVVGTGHPPAYERVEGVTLRGYVEDLADAFAPGSLYVQPSRMDTFPVSTLEAMRAGLPPLVTTETGTRSVVREVDERLVVDPRPEALSNGVSRYFDSPRAVRHRLAADARKRGSTFDRGTRQRKFRVAFERILEAL